MRVFNLETMQLCHTQPAHEAEILTMCYSSPVTNTESAEKPSLVLLATAGRDRLVHIFDATDQYRHTLTLDNHSSSVTAVRFTGDGRRLLSCGGDNTMTLNKVSGHEVHFAERIFLSGYSFCIQKDPAVCISYCNPREDLRVGHRCNQQVCHHVGP